MNRRYFDEEMRYLQEAGKAFAEAHPDVAQYLNVESITDRDPYVERLFEGFAFLTGRIREQLDDELPQYTEGLLSLIAPQYLTPLPSCSIVQFNPKPGLVQEPATFERGTEVRSVPVGKEYTTCRFQTTQDLVLQPIHLKNAALVYNPDQTSRLRLRFELDRGMEVGGLDLSRIRLYLHAEAATALTLHRFCTRHVTAIAAGPSGAAPEQMARLAGQRWVTPAGFDREEALLPESPYTFSGYRLLQEYLCFPRKFWFVDINGLDRLRLREDMDAFDVDLHFDQSYPENRPIRTENIRLFCSPVVNLFDTDAEPIRVQGFESEYRLTPSLRQRGNMEVFDIQSVTGIEDETGRRHTYEPFYAFRDGAQLPQGRHYTASRRQGVTSRLDLYLMLSLPEETGGRSRGDGAGRAEPLRLVPETVSTSIRATNGDLPNEKLQEDMITALAPDVPQVIRPTNLTKPTPRLYPPIDDTRNYFWKLISHWSLNYLSVASKEALIGSMSLYDWTRGDAMRRRNQRRLQGIEQVEWKPAEVLFRGGIIRGTEVIIRVREEHFVGEGDLCLFGEVMSRFLSMYASINSFAHLTIESIPSGKRYTWKPQRGDKPTL